MNTILSIVCITLLVFITYIISKGIHENKNYYVSCKSLYIPEDLDVNLALENYGSMKRLELEKKARSLGATKEFIDKLTLLELKIYVIQSSITSKHIITDDLEDSINRIEENNILSGINYEVDRVELNTIDLAEDSQNFTLQALQEDFGD